MFEIKINVNAPELSDALNNLATAIYSLTQPHGSELEENTQPDAKEVTPNEPEAPAAIQEQPTPETVKKTVTLDELSRAGAALIDAGKMPDLIALLKEYNVQAITQLAPDTYPAFAEKLESLGAKF